MKSTDNLPNNTAMAPPTADAEKIATKGKEAKDKEAKDLKAKKEKEEIDAGWKESWERVESALAQGDDYFLKKYPHFKGITLQSVPYDVAMWQMYEEDGSN
ncbi:hypothetical protein FSOLCH5_008750 [Fusarium solani]